MSILDTLKIVIKNKWARFRIKNTDFTIISNNCWGGFIYQRLKLQYNSPTIGLFMYASDYVEFCRCMEYYVEQEIKFIENKESKYYEEFKDNINNSYPIGKIGNVEIHFMHYASKEEAIIKWKKRVKRINWDKLIFKFSQRDLCTKNEIEEFMNLEYKNKICFTHEDNIKDTIYVPELKNIGNKDETDITLRYLNIVKYINKEAE